MAFEKGLEKVQKLSVSFSPGMKGRRGPTGSRRGTLSHPPPPQDPRHGGGCPLLALPGEREH